MKAQTPFWPLLKNELTLARFGGTGQVAFMLLLYSLCVGAFPLLVVFGDRLSHGNIAVLFDAGFLPIMAFLFLSNLTVWIAYATVPALCELLSAGGSIPGIVQNLGAFEFLFTRAVDRRMLFRARTIAFFIFALTPLFLNVLASPFAPEITLGTADSTSAEAVNVLASPFAPEITLGPATSAEAVSRHEQYLRAFPASHPGTGRATLPPGQIILAHGTLIYAAWLAWGGTLAFLLLQGYGALVAKQVKPNNWWTTLFPGAPIFIVLAALILVARGSLGTHLNIYETSFLFFATHPLAMVIVLAVLVVVIQTWCERRFSQLEIY